MTEPYKNIENKENNYMSLIVLLKNEKGIVAASDSKATTTNMGILEEDKKRGEIQKVFKSDDFIFSICGQNKILVNNETVYIEDFINHILNTKEYIKNNNLKFIEFINYLFGAIGNKNELINSPIIILCGYKINNKYEVCEIELTNNINKFSYTGDVCFMRRGCVNLTPKDFLMPDGLEINQMEDFAKEYINTIIKLGNLVLPYNPIGGKIQIKNLI